MTYAMVTGGTSGIGLAFAHYLGAHGMNLVLVARDAARLADTAARLSDQYAVEVEPLVADLAEASAVTRVIERISDPKRPIRILVNDAGFGVHGSLLEPDTELQERAINVMITAVLRLSTAAANTMAERGFGAIVNVASASAWISTGNYSAIKRWVVSYSQALALEAAPLGVRVVAVCPGWVKTQFHERSGVERPHLPDWAWVPVDEIPAAAFSAAAAGRVVSVPTLLWRSALLIAQHGPSCIATEVSKRINASRAKN